MTDYINIDPINTEKPAEWHEARRKGIGGSDAAVIMLGENHPFTTPYQLWQQKMEMCGDTAETAPMKRGTVMEDIIAKIYEEETGRTAIIKEKAGQHKEYEFMIGNVDRIITDKQRQDKGILEIKCPGMKTFLKCKREGPLDYYIIQLQHYLAVEDLLWGSFAIFNTELWELITFDIERDDNFIAMMIEAEKEFYSYMTSGKFPEEVKKTRNIKLPKVDEDVPLIRIETPEWIEAVQFFKEARELKEDSIVAEEAAKERLMNLMELNKAEIAEGGGIRIYNRESAGRITFDVKAFKSDFPEMDLSRYERQGNPIKVFRPYFLD